MKIHSFRVCWVGKGQKGRWECDEESGILASLESLAMRKLPDVLYSPSSCIGPSIFPLMRTERVCQRFKGRWHSLKLQGGHVSRAGSTVTSNPWTKRQLTQHKFPLGPPVHSSNVYSTTLLLSKSEYNPANSLLCRDEKPQAC